MSTDYGRLGTRLAGHGLRYEGKPMPDWVRDGRATGPGAALCECGKRSPSLPSTAARRRWHREHKTAVRTRAVAGADSTAEPSAPATTTPT